MAIYLKKFETQAAYEAAESSLILPNVSLTVDNNTVHYNPISPTPPTPTYESVDLGLPSGTLWAKYNVGATSETEYGNYYQYGKGAAQYAATSGDSDYSGMESPLALSADTAAQVMGGQWHMPTSAQCQELIDNTTSAWTTNYEDSNVAGVVLTSTADTNVKLFFPAAGRWYDGYNNDDGSIGYYLSSTPYESYNAYDLYQDSEGVNVYSGDRCGGYSVRAVMDA